VLDSDDGLQRALDIAYGYLNRRDRTQAEIRRCLTSDGIERPVIEQVIGTLTDQGFLDDARFARLFTQDKRELEQWGSDRIRRTLLDWGIDRGLVDGTLEAEAEGTELDRALALLRRRFPVPPRERRERDRALGVMVRKGYDVELALDALTAYARDADTPMG
jgi:regulatory protein